MLKEKDIYVFHSHIEIPEYERGDCEKLEAMLSIWDKVNFKSINIGFTLDEEKDILRIPRGCDVEYIAYLLNRNIKIMKDHNKIDRSNMNLKIAPRDDDQKKSLAFLLGERDFKYTKEHSQLALNLETGYGKTYCAIAYLAQMKEKGCIILDESKFLTQWKEKAIEYTNLKDCNILVVKGKALINKIISNPDKYRKYDLYLMSNRSLTSYGNSEGYDKLNDLFKALRIGIKIYDEAHESFGAIVKIDCYTKVKRTLYLTATAGRSDPKENKIFSFLFKRIPSFGESLVKEEDRYIDSMIFMINTKPSYVDIAKCDGIHGFNTKAYIDYILKDLKTPNRPYNDMERFFYTNGLRLENKAIKIMEYIVSKYIGLDGKIAIMVSKNEQIETLREYLECIYDGTVEIGTFSSIVALKDRDKEKEKKLILSTEKSLGKGTDIADLRVLINLLSYKSHIQCSQFMGRLRYNSKFDVKYFEIVDEGFKKSYNQYKKRKSVIANKSRIVKEVVAYKK